MMRLLRALKGMNEGRPPVWLMRQAGRYMPQYQKIRQGRRLWEMFHNPETVVEVTLLPEKLLGVDGSILFSDILTVLDGLGQEYDFVEGVGPVIKKPVERVSDLRRVEGAYAPVVEAIRMLKRELKTPLLGFAGAPFTIASYLIEGKTSRDLKKTKAWLYTDPKGFGELIEKITEETIVYLKAQIEAGVEAVQLFDSWANSLTVHTFREVALKAMEKIVRALPVPVILFCRGSCLFAQELASAEPAAVSLDWNGDLPTIRKTLPSTIAVQGNLDPAVLLGSREAIQKEVERLLRGMEGDPGYIFNLGHGIYPETPFDNVKFLIESVGRR